MSKRVHEIAKERGVPAKELVAQLQAAGVDVKAVSSSVEESVVEKALGNGAAKAPAGDAKPATPRPARPVNPNLRRVTIDDDGPRGRASRPARSTPSSRQPDTPRVTASPRPAGGVSNVPRDPRAGSRDPRAGVPRDPRAGQSRAAGAAAGGSPANVSRDPRPGQARDPRAGQPRDPRAGQSRAAGAAPGGSPASVPRDPRAGQPRDPRAGQPRDPRAGQPRDPRAGQPRDPRAGQPRDPRVAQPTARAERPAGPAAPPRQSAGNGAAAPAPAQTEPAPPRDDAAAAARPAEHKRPTRDSLQGERAPGASAGRRRVVIDSQASRRAAGGPGGGPPVNQPPRRQRRGRRRRGVYDEEAESRPSAREVITEPDAIQIPSGATVKDVAEYLEVAVPEVMKKLMALGELKTLTQTLSDDAVQVLATELGKEVQIVHSEDETLVEPEYHDEEAELVERPPVVTIMGHVDHGKTSLLDAIRETEVAAGEAGGITQHIGAYQVHHDGKTISFLDTPGHEAFTAMRARGAKVTDIAVIVVAADDGVKPQTQEAVDHAKEAEVPILVAINKIDKEGADPNRVRGEMAAIGLQPVEWGGDTEFVDVSARTKEGLDNLLETILVMAEVEELRANPDAPASGTVIESKLDPGRGPVVTILIMRGTLEVGDSIVAGAHWGRVRAMNDFMGNRVGQAGPGDPVEVLGFDGVPQAGEHVHAVENERRARQLANERASRLKAEALARQRPKRVSLEDISKEGLQELNLLLKADVAGSLEAIEDEIAKLPQEEVAVNVIRSAVGAVTESDVMLAAASDAVILAFNVRPVGDARSVAEREGVEIRHYAVIYRAIEDLRSAMQGLLRPEEVEEALGSAEVRQIFRASRVGTIAGSHVTEGKITRGAKVRLVRDGTVIYDGEIASLRRFNDDVREVASGFDCGIVLRDYADVKEGDVLETYATRQVERELG